MRHTSHNSFCLIAVLFGAAVALIAQDSVKPPPRPLKLSPYSPPKTSTIAEALRKDIRPRITTIRELASNPRKLDKQFVQLRAFPVMGWEGDNYLYEQPHRPGMSQSGMPALYIAGVESPERFEAIRQMADSGADFRGYFHYVPNPKSNGMFNPGPLQIDVVAASKLK